MHVSFYKYPNQLLVVSHDFITKTAYSVSSKSIMILLILATQDVPVATKVMPIVTTPFHKSLSCDT